jgi:LPXTG-motif cell wall-anchored protein
MNRFTILSAVLGFSLLVWGAAKIYHPLGFIVAGALLLVLAFVTARKKKTA